jgi:DNA-binding NarL/FixJ family response regulator
VSLFVDHSHVSLFVALIGMAAISGFVLTKSIEEEDADSARIWVTMFGATSLVAAWMFGRLV